MKSPNSKVDIIFCAIPFSELDHIYSAPAILRGVVESEGYTAKTIDFGLELFNLCNRDKAMFDNIQQYFHIMNPILSELEFNILQTWKSNIIKFVKDHPSRYYGISILSYMQQSTAYEICDIIRDVRPNAKIVIGGRGAKVFMMSEFHKKFKMKGMEKLMPAGEFLKKRNLCDFAVVGDGEDPIIEILQGGKKSIITYESRESFSYPEPNYDDYLFDQYIWESGEIAFPITGSKGCVRDCDFCDVRFQFGKFKYRSGQDIANEMVSMQKKYGVSKFQFTDSLVNGGLKSFREFCTIIANHNRKNPNHTIKWTGQYICRPELTMPKDLYSLMAESGAEGLTIGAESGSNYVLEKMNKKTTVEALLTELEEFRKHKITCVLLFISGHWTERWEDFIEHCETLVKIMPYARDGTISGIQVGFLALLLDGTPSHNKITEGQILAAGQLHENLWFNKENPADLKDRLYRKLIVSLLGKKLNMPKLNEGYILRAEAEKFSNHIEDINNFYDQYREDMQSPSLSQEAYYNFDTWYNKLLAKDSVLIQLSIFSEEYNGQPNVKIMCNDSVHYEGELTAGKHIFEFKEMVKDVTDLKLSIEMLGKTNKDTLVDNNGNILKDKHILVKSLFINNYDITKDYDFVNSYLGKIQGLWQNGKLEMNFKLPFDNWYNSVSTKNHALAPQLASRLQPSDFDKQFNKLLSVTESLK
jgi:radical SAM superfamily enzyme YgiQ (UPF0313 family)